MQESSLKAKRTYTTTLHLNVQTLMATSETSKESTESQNAMVVQLSAPVQRVRKN